MNPPPELVVVIPVYNEAANIESVLADWADAILPQTPSFLLLVIDDGSTDTTPALLDKLCAQNRLLQVVHKPNAGHGAACRTGYDEAIRLGSPWVLQIDSDGQCDPAYFPQFWAARDKSDCVFGFRKTRGDGMARKLISLACRRLTFLAAGVDPGDANVPYRLMRGAVLGTALQKIPYGFNIVNVALSVVFHRSKGLRWAYVPIHFRDRQGGVNSINIPKIIKMGYGMLRELRQIR